MAKVPQYSDEMRERVYLLYAECGNMLKVAKETGVPHSTVKDWIAKKKKNAPDELEALRKKRQAEAIETVKREFIEKADDIIDKGLTLLDKRFTRALESERTLDAVMDAIERDDGISPASKKELTKVLSELEIRDVRAISTAIGTIYDKRALAKGESTGNMAVEIKLPEGAREYAE